MPATLTRRHMEPLEQAGSRYAELMRLAGHGSWCSFPGSLGLSDHAGRSSYCEDTRVQGKIELAPRGDLEAHGRIEDRHFDVDRASLTSEVLGRNALLRHRIDGGRSAGGQSSSVLFPSQWPWPFCSRALSSPDRAHRGLPSSKKAISAKQEGGGPALSNPSGERTQAADHSKAMQALHQAKELDQQGQEQKCMQAVGRVEVTVPSGAK